MFRAFAAIYDPTRRDLHGDHQRVGGALHEPDGDMQSGSLVLAWTGSPAPAGERPLAFLDGQLYEPPGRAEERGGDNAVLSARFAREGDALFVGLRGDFALVLHDPQTDQLIVARDHMGGRGVFFHATGDRLAMASDVRFLLALLPSVPEPDLVAIAHLLALSGQRVDDTLYSGIHRLRAGHVLRAGRGSLSTSRYWELRYRRPDARTREDHVDGLRDVLTTAVGRRSFGPSTGIMLSGGLDSSTVAAVASTLSRDRRPRRAYSATFPGHPTVDEGDLIGQVCAATGLDSTRIVVHKGSVAAGALEYIEHWRLPPPSPNLFFWLPLLRRAAADGTDAMLDGEGGDEIFGFSLYLVADHLRRGRIGAAIEAVRAIPGGGPHITLAKVWPFMREYGVKGATPAWLHRAIRRSRAATTYAPQWLRPAVLEAFMDSDAIADWKAGPGPRWWSHLVERVTRGSSVASTHDHVRRRAALSGIEPRHPLVDVDVIQYMLAVPPELSFDTRYSRPLVREAMAGILPDDVRLRPRKSTFDAVFHEALTGSDLAVARDLLRPGNARLEDYVDLEMVARDLLDQPPPPDERLDWSQFLWRLLTAELWLRVRSGESVDLAFAPAQVKLIGP